MQSQTSKLRSLLADSNKTIVVGGAHNGISAKAVEEAGYDAIWASGLEIATSHCVPDANILTMSDVLYAAKQMVDATDIPVIVDCDNGFGNAVNAMRTVSEFEKIGVAGVCMEDNIFPKRNSFYAQDNHTLESPEEFAAKIRAAVSARKSPYFCIIARTEAIISGMGIDEALKRTKLYVEAGADLIVPHSKILDASEIEAFAAAWDGSAPMIAIPTKYKYATIDELSTIGFKIVIYANFAIRSAIKAMTETMRRAREAGYAASVDDAMVPLSKMQEMVGFEAMTRAERAYVHSNTPSPVKEKVAV